MGYQVSSRLLIKFFGSIMDQYITCLYDYILRRVFIKSEQMHRATFSLFIWIQNNQRT